MYRSPDGHAWHLLHTDGQEGDILKSRGGVGSYQHPLHPEDIPRILSSAAWVSVSRAGKSFVSTLCALGQARGEC